VSASGVWRPAVRHNVARKVLRVCGRLHTCRTATPSLHACRSHGLQPHRAWLDLPGGGGWCCAPRDVRAGGQRREPTRKLRLPRQCRASNRGAHGRYCCCTDPTATACACQHVADSPQCYLHSCCCCCRRSDELGVFRWRCELGAHHLSASHRLPSLLQSRAFTSLVRASCFCVDLCSPHPHSSGWHTVHVLQGSGERVCWPEQAQLMSSLRGRRCARVVSCTVAQGVCEPHHLTD
jgi:hypothetical protein